MPSGKTQVGILIIDDDQAGQVAMGHLLDSEGWKVRVVPWAANALQELATGEWTLVIANVAMTGVDGPIFTTLKELAQAPAIEEPAAPGQPPAETTGKRPRVRVLFLVPEILALEARPVLDRERLPSVLKPVNLHDFLEKISDLLLEAQAIANPIRSIRYEVTGRERRKKDRRSARDRRDTGMFAARENYTFTEEEITEYEQQEKEESQHRKQPRKNLGEP